MQNTNTISVQNKYKGFLWIFFGSLFFVVGHVIIKFLVQTYPLFEISFFRFAIPVFIILPLFISKKVKLSFKNPGLLIFRAIVGTLAMLFYYQAIRLGHLGLMILLFNFCVIWAFILSSIYLKEKPTLAHYIAIGVAFIGLILILRPEHFSKSWVAAIFALIASIFGALSIVSVKKLRDDHNSYSIVFIYCLFAALTVALPAANNFVIPGKITVFLLSVLGILGFLSHFFMTKAYRYITASDGASMSLVMIPMSYFFSVLFFSEHVDIFCIIGIAIVIGSLYYIAKNK